MDCAERTGPALALMSTWTVAQQVAGVVGDPRGGARRRRLDEGARPRRAPGAAALVERSPAGAVRRAAMNCAALVAPTCPLFSAAPPGRYTPCAPPASPTGKNPSMFDCHQASTTSPPLLCCAQTSTSSIVVSRSTYGFLPR